VLLFCVIEADGLCPEFKARKKNALGSLVYQRACAQAHWNPMAVGSRDRHPKNTLHGHSVTAITPIVEETTGAVPLTVIVVSGVDIVLAPKCCLKACELDAFGFFSVAFGFRNLVDHA
jgi:hypothetical protein